jgi:hypothetical protein
MLVTTNITNPQKIVIATKNGIPQARVPYQSHHFLVRGFCKLVVYGVMSVMALRPVIHVDLVFLLG